MGRDTRVGIGFDFHAFVVGRELVLGGVRIPFERGLEGHSDADALLHAVTDAILGAAGLGDIGTHFPDTDARFRGISSLTMLAEACRLIREKGFQVGNVDVVVLTEVPKIGPHVDAIKANLAHILQVSTEDIGIKATTMEGRGMIGRREGIAAQAVTLLYGAERSGVPSPGKRESDG